MPQFLRLQVGANVVRFLENVPVREIRHWIGNVPQPCMGPGCKFCAADIPAREQCLIMVEMDGQQGFIRLPPVAWDAFYSQRGAAVLGAKVEIMKTGTGVSTRYMFRDLAQDRVVPAAQVPPPAPNPVPPVDVAGMVSRQALLGSIRNMADQYAKWGRPRELVLAAALRAVEDDLRNEEIPF